jgi:hypothetical protein
MDYPCCQRPPGLDLISEGAQTAGNGLRRRGAAAEPSSGDPAPPPRVPFVPGRSIRYWRLGLDWKLVDPDRAIEIRASEFARTGSS